jgi:hypothetical protein
VVQVFGLCFLDGQERLINRMQVHKHTGRLKLFYRLLPGLDVGGLSNDRRGRHPRHMTFQRMPLALIAVG